MKDRGRSSFVGEVSRGLAFEMRVPGDSGVLADFDPRLPELKPKFYYRTFHTVYIEQLVNRIIIKGEIHSCRSNLNRLIMIKLFDLSSEIKVRWPKSHLIISEIFLVRFVTVSILNTLSKLTSASPYCSESLALFRLNFLFSAPSRRAF